MTWNDLTYNSQSLGKKYDVLSKCSKDTLNINNVNTFYSLRVAKYNKSEFQNLQDLKETERAWLYLSLNLVMLKNSSFWLFP